LVAICLTNIKTKLGGRTQGGEEDGRMEVEKGGERDEGGARGKEGARREEWTRSKERRARRRSR
jgi:hypothetical protein